MGWPQYVMLAWFVFMAVTVVRREVANRAQSSGWATAGVFMGFAMIAGLAYVMHAGGFW